MADQTNNPFDRLDFKLEAIEASLADIRNLLTSSPQTEQKYYTIAEAARKLGVAQITLYRNGQSGKVPTKKIGARLMVPGSFVDR